MNTDVIKVNLSELLEARGVSMYKLAQDTQLAYTTLWKLQTKRTQGISFDVLEKVCAFLECTPGELLSVAPDEKKHVAKKKSVKKAAK